MYLRQSLALGILSVLLSSASAFAEDTVKIGVIQPLTGSVAYNGTTDVNGIKLALGEINAKGGVLGKKVEIVVEDGQCKPADTVNAAEKLIQRDKVVALIGAFCSSATAAIMPVAQSNKVPLVTGVSSAANLTEKGNPWFFRATETDALLAKSFAKILVNQLKLKKVAYVGVNDDFGRGSVEEFEKQMSALGAATVMKEYFEHGTSDFYTLLTKLKASGADGVFVSAETQDGSTFVKQKAELGLPTKVFGVGSWATADFMQLAGQAANGIYAAVPYASTMKTPKNEAFVKAYQDQYKVAPGKYSAAGYNALNIVVDAIARAQSTDPGKVREALLKTDYEGPNGHFRFDEKGQATGFTVVLVQLENGTPVVVESNTVEK
ncbi:MAG TPA: ABC transporter substrate-binding protein [Bradyrhizobium sp.]|jgi:branched-chain amino acid transport system substrate-binding protein